MQRQLCLKHNKRQKENMNYCLSSGGIHKISTCATFLKSRIKSNSYKNLVAKIFFCRTLLIFLRNHNFRNTHFPDSIGPILNPRVSPRPGHQRSFGNNLHKFRTYNNLSRPYRSKSCQLGRETIAIKEEELRTRGYDSAR